MLFFADLKQRFGGQASAEVAEGTRVQELAGQLGLDDPLIKFAVNEEIVPRDAVLNEDDVVAFLRPMSGGCR
jgi:sulfur carrier protein ThiS